MLSSVASMIDQFNMPNIRLMQALGYEVHVACNFKQGNTCDVMQLDRLQKKLSRMHVVQHQWDCPRSIRPFQECCRAYAQLWKLTGRYAFAWMHCHSPIGGAIARIAAHRREIPVIYTAHGFHFYHGAPLLNWLLYYPVEKALAHWTDVLITVNREDYWFAKRRLGAGKVCYIPGVGVDIRKYALKPFETKANGREMLCKEFGIPLKASILLSVGELNRGKNHRMVVAALANLGKKDVYYLVCGQGKLCSKLQQYADRLGIGSQIRMPGFREDMAGIYQNTDIFVFPSKREGMPVALMEAMAAGMPCVVSDVRGNRELIGDVPQNWLRFSLYSTRQLGYALSRLLEDESLRRECGKHNREKVAAYSLDRVAGIMRKIYKEMQDSTL